MATQVSVEAVWSPVKHRVYVWSQTGIEWNVVQVFSTWQSAEGFIEQMPKELHYKIVSSV